MERDYHLYPRHPGQLQRLLRTVGVAAVGKVKSHLDYENALAGGPARFNRLQSQQSRCELGLRVSFGLQTANDLDC